MHDLEKKLINEQIFKINTYLKGSDILDFINDINK